MLTRTDDAFDIKALLDIGFKQPDFAGNYRDLQSESMMLSGLDRLGSAYSVELPAWTLLL